jgi:hypothetical protein
MAQKETPAAMRLGQTALRLWRAMEYAIPRLPTSTQAALAGRIEGADTRWVLALVLAGWRLSERPEPGAADVEALLNELGAWAVVQQISRLRMLLPDSFQLFVDNAREAETDPKLIGASTYLVSAVHELGETRLNALHTWLRGAQVASAGRALSQRFPVPDPGRPPERAPLASKPVPPRPPSRAERFDRADLLPSRAVPRAAPRMAASSNTPLRPPTPVLDEAALTRAYLFSLGWDGAEVERLMRGPDGPSGKSSA